MRTGSLRVKLYDLGLRFGVNLIFGQYIKTWLKFLTTLSLRGSYALGVVQRRAGCAGPVESVAGVHTAHGVGSPDAAYPTNMDGAPVKMGLGNHTTVLRAKPINAFFNAIEVATSLAFYPGGHPRVCLKFFIRQRLGFSHSPEFQYFISGNK